MSLKPLALALLASSAATLTLAADLPSRKGVPTAPTALSACSDDEGIPTDAFGFTTGSDVGAVGSFGPSLTYGGAFGTRAGKLNSHGAVLQGSYGLLPCLEVGPYLLGGYSKAAAGGVSADERSFGAGVEMKYRLLGRDLHGIGLTIVLDPSANRADPDGAGRFHLQYGPAHLRRQDADPQYALRRAQHLA